MARGADRGNGSGFSSVPVLSRFAAQVSALTTLEDLLEATVEVAAAALGADSVHVGRIDRPHGRLRVLRNAGRLADWELESPPDESYLIGDYPQLVCTTEQAKAWRGNVDDDTTAENDRLLLARQGKAHALSVPLISSAGVWGELFVTRFRSRPFTACDEEVAVVIAGLAAAGLARVLGDQRLRELAYTDALTGLANRRAVEDQLETWASDPVTAQTLTVMLCDVNGLKEVNDTHGHLVGDRLIREVAGHVSAATGRLPGAIAARIGGDEFLVAGPCPGQALITGLVEELTQAASRLSLGRGVSCGTASATTLVRPEASPQSLVQSLLRIADSEQYRNKRLARAEAKVDTAQAARDMVGDAPDGRAYRDARGDAPASPPVASSSTSTTPIQTSVIPSGSEPLGLFTTLQQSTPVKDRLAHAAHIICGLAGGVAWWVSKTDAEHATVRAVSCGTVRDTGVTDGLWPMVELDPTVYLLADFPTTTQAVQESAVFYVDTLTGDPAERQILIQTGFQSMIAAGALDSEGQGWLVEIYGDSLTHHLHDFASLLHTATRQSTTPRQQSVTTTQ